MITNRDIDLYVILKTRFNMPYPRNNKEYLEYLDKWLKQYFDNVDGWGFPIPKKYCPKPMTLEQFIEDKEFAW